MPTVHSVSRSFLVQLGVSDPPDPGNADKIREQLRRDPYYFHLPLPSRADEAGATNSSDVASTGHETEEKSLSTSKSPCKTRKENSPTSVINAAENVSTSKDANGLTDDPNPGICGDFDVPIAEIAKRRHTRSTLDLDAEETSKLNSSARRTSLRKRKAPVLLNGSFTLNNKVKIEDNEDVEGRANHQSTPRTAQACVECCRAHRTCAKTSLNSPCERCTSIPGLICRFEPSDQRKEAYQSTPEKIDFRTKGVNKTSNGSWRVDIRYHGNNYYVGLFKTLEQAALVNEIARGKLPVENGSKLTKKEVELHVKSAREAFALSKLGNRDSGGEECRANQSTPEKIDFRTKGLSKTSSGSWQIHIRYHGKNYYMGSYKTLEQAALVNEIARGKLPVENGSKLTKEEVELHVKSAREAALENQSTPDEIDFRTKGVRKTTSGAWEVNFRYHGKLYYIGRFNTLEQAALANEIARGKLTVEKGTKPTKSAAKSNVKSAREAVLKALSELDNSVNLKTPDAPLDDHISTDRSLPKCPRPTQSCVECRRAHRTCVMTTLNTTCERCTTIPGLICRFEPPAQGKRNGIPLQKNNFRPIVVPQENSGKWRVQIRYKGKARSMGTFSTQDHASVANKIARGMLNTTKDMKLTDREVERNVKLAKEAALDTVSGLGDSSHQNLEMICTGSSKPTAAMSKCLLPKASRSLKDQKQKSNVVGVYPTRSGTWKVEVTYHGKFGYGGTFKSKEQAALVNEVMRGMLDTTGDLQLTSGEIEQNIKLAKKAGMESLKAMCCQIHTSALQNNGISGGKASPLPSATNGTLTGTLTLPSKNMQSTQLEPIEQEIECDIAHKGDPQVSPPEEEMMYIEQWQCDVCHTARFSSYDETLEHERNCREKKNQEISDGLNKTRKTADTSQSKKRPCATSEDVVFDPGELDTTYNVAIQGADRYTQVGQRIHNKCSQAGCSNLARKGGVCWTHGAKNGLETRKFYPICTNQPSTKGGAFERHCESTCSHEGCTHLAQNGGLCIAHRSQPADHQHCLIRMTVNGRDEMAAGLCQLLEMLWVPGSLNSEAQNKELMRPGKRKHTLCGYPGCAKEAHKRGKCAKHDLCDHPECTNRAGARGKCRMHGRNANRKICSHERCTTFAQVRGFCKRHRPLCNHPECTNKVNSARGKCQRHDSQEQSERRKQNGHT